MLLEDIVVSFIFYFKLQKGARLPMVDGDIELQDVTFAYPSRPGRLIFKSFNLSIPSGAVDLMLMYILNVV